MNINKQLQWFLLLIIWGILQIGCADSPYDTDGPQLVVEGWIDAGGHPIVFVTTSLPFTSTDKNQTDFSSHILNWAKVTVSDGEQTVVLTGRVMRNYPIPYGFTTGQMRGQVGKTYKLTVDYADYHAQAITTIPHPCPIDSFRYALLTKADTLFELRAYASHLNLPTGGACKFFVMRRGKDKHYLSCNMGLFAAQAVSPHAVFPVLQGHRLRNGKHDKYSPYFSTSDTLLVKFATLDAAAYHFWKSYEENLSLSSSPFFGSANALQGNINGALGYWCGYGTQEYVFGPIAPRGTEKSKK